MEKLLARSLIVAALLGAALLCAVLVLGARFVRLPECARPAAIEARYAHELARLRELAEHQERLHDGWEMARARQEAETLLAAPAIVGASVWEEVSPHGRKGWPILDEELPDGRRTWIHRVPRPGRSVTNLWSASGRDFVQYSAVLEAAGPERGYTLWLDLALLAERP